MKLTQIAFAAMLAPLAMCAQAEVTFTPMATYHLFDDDKKPVDDETGYALGLGYRFTPAMGIEVHYGRTEPELASPLKGDGRDSRLTLDYYYAFNADGSFSPYILLGGGQENLKFDNGYKSEGVIANAALGAFWRFNQYVALRGEVRDVYNTDIETNDIIIGLGLEFSGRDNSSGAADEPAPQPEPEQQIEEAAAAVAPVADAVVDSDGDGVADADDKCPNTPAGVQVDADGCPADADKDGVPDYRDQCPTTAAGVVVDDKGCDKILTEAINKQLSVTFDSGKAVVKDEYKAEIGEVAALLKQYPSTSAEIQGHTDSSGKKASNDALSQQRADAVKSVLVKEFGVDASRVSAKGYGSSQPVADNKTAEGKAQNRRVIAIISGEAKKVQKKK